MIIENIVGNKKLVFLRVYSVVSVPLILKTFLFFQNVLKADECYKVISVEQKTNKSGYY